MLQMYGIMYSEKRNGWLIIKTMIKDYYLCSDGKTNYWFETSRRAVVYKNKIEALKALEDELNDT